MFDGHNEPDGHKYGNLFLDLMMKKLTFHHLLIFITVCIMIFIEFYTLQEKNRKHKTKSRRKRKISRQKGTKKRKRTIKSRNK